MHRVEASVELGEADLARFAELSQAEWPSPENYLPKIKEQITAILIGRGYPEPGASVFHRGTVWRQFEAGDRPEPGEAVSPGWGYVRRNADPLTPEREAADLYVIVLEVEAALQAADAALVFAHALRLGAAANRFNSRRLHLKSVTRGVKVGKALRSAAATTNALHGDLRQARFAKMAELVPTMSVDSAAAQCETEGLGGREAIKRQWNRHKEKRDR
jgi:hypothetical protein